MQQLKRYKKCVLTWFALAVGISGGSLGTAALCSVILGEALGQTVKTGVVQAAGVDAGPVVAGLVVGAVGVGATAKGVRLSCK